ncbi:hypothetical protein RFI_01923 [Reticulomyxa filosa]|uniref:Uncharacterized protein n=1 Tax=Reticulomyxa filosa TaxID=46433 RepID=X6PAG4_RETFI|nr:hypothetical protein RFI_01923 [Reticulomyxa filosa]|eukprot:ETO35151.1 hypothetical protein RFI_01923 [Reticulomyxa filosa]
MNIVKWQENAIDSGHNYRSNKKAKKKEKRMTTTSGSRGASRFVVITFVGWKSSKLFGENNKKLAPKIKAHTFSQTWRTLSMEKDWKELQHHFNELHQQENDEEEKEKNKEKEQKKKISPSESEEVEKVSQWRKCYLEITINQKTAITERNQANKNASCVVVILKKEKKIENKNEISNCSVARNCRHCSSIVVI